MQDTANPSNQKTGILLSRNHPIALVVGAAGFLGSHLAEKLLSLGVQVVGVDSLSSGRKENLNEAFKHKSFHFITSEIEDSKVNDFLVDLPRLDYAFFIAENQTSSALYKLGLENFLKLVLDHDHSKVVLVSSVEMYDSKTSSLTFLKQAEEDFAKFAKHHKLNARIIRLDEVFGPKMHFRQNGAFSRLIKARLEKKLISEQTALDFSSRGLFVSDATSLIIKSALSGSTAGKIYDGCLPQPVKVAEIKQILLDPLWHKERGFVLSELPPWPTPNLARSLKELGWKPKADLVETLKQTIDFFDQDDEARHFALKTAKISETQHQLKVPGWSFEDTDQKQQGSDKGSKKRKSLFSLKFWFSLLLFFGLIFPLLNFFIGSYFLPLNLESARKALEQGELEQAQKQLVIARVNMSQIKSLGVVFVVAQSSSLNSPSLQQISKLIEAENRLVSGISQTVEATQKSLVGDGVLSSSQARSVYQEAEGNLASALAQLSDPSLKTLKIVPSIDQITDSQAGKYFYNLAQQGRAVQEILPQVFPPDGEKTYLVLLQDNSVLKPSGGVLISFAKLKLSQGKLSLEDPSPISALDALLTSNLTGAGGSAIKFSTSNTQADFPSFAQYFTNLYQKVSPEIVDGVFLIDQTGFNSLEQILGVGSASHLEAKEASLSAQSAQSLQLMVNGLISTNQENLLKVAQVLESNLKQKHLSLFSTDLKTLSLLNNQGWSGNLLTSKSEQGLADFLALAESSNGQIKKSLNLNTQISGDGGVSEVLKISWENDQGKVYQTHLQIFLPLGTRLNSAKFNNQNYLAQINSKVDFGRAVYSLDLEVPAGSSAQLEINYNLSSKVGEQKNEEATKNNVSYSLKVLKQSGTKADNFEWSLSSPEGWQVVNKSDNLAALGIKTDLLEDQRFELTFRKP